MLTEEKIEELRTNARLAMIDERDFEREKAMPTSLEWLQSQMRAWKGWYLKSNQPKNYFRVTRIIPPGTIDNPFFWSQKFQVWVKGKILLEYAIDQATFDHFAKLWGKTEDTGMSYAIYRSPAQLNHTSHQ